MKPTECLFIAAEQDNVATALANLSAGQVVPLLSGEGRKVSTVELRSHVPRFFKVNVRELHDGDEIRKWGEVIGRAVVRVHRVGGDDGPARALPVGSPVHIGNFIPSEEVLNFWGGALTSAASIIVSESRAGRGSYFPYELGRAAKTFAPGQEIRLGDLRIDDERLRSRLLPRADAGLVVGSTLAAIAQDAYLRLGCCVGGSYRYPGERGMVESLSRVYRFFKGRLYEVA